MTFFFWLMVLSANLERFSESEIRCCQRLAEAETTTDYRGLFSYSELCAYLANANDLSPSEPVSNE